MKHLPAICKSVFASLIILTSNSTSAALVERDWAPGSGDAYLTYDPDRNLEWLDVTATKRLSVNEVLSGTGGWINAGFRYATYTDLQTLFAAAGISEHENGYWQDYEQVYTLLNHIGITYQANLGDQFETWAYIADSFGSQGQIWYSHIMAATNGVTAVEPFYSTTWTASQDSLIGSFLVRDATPLPLPAPIALLAIGSIFLASFAHRSKNPTNPG